MSTGSENLGRLRWRCRRGMKELDALLVRFLDRHYLEAGPVQQHAFERLLEVEDDELWRWLSGRNSPPDADLQALVDHLLAQPVGTP